MTTDNEARFDYDHSVVGVEVELGSLTLTPKLVADYCIAVGETNPIYTDVEAAKAGPYGGLTAPPAMLPSLPFGHSGPGGAGLDAKVRFGNTVMLAGSRLEAFAPVRLGDTITARVQVKEVFPKTGRSGTMLFLVHRTSYTNQAGVQVVASERSTVYREV
ncbi:MAG: MaoC family dehydratase [Dehalococcoidia bacterium]